MNTSISKTVGEWTFSNLFALVTARDSRDVDLIVGPSLGGRPRLGQLRTFVIAIVFVMSGAHGVTALQCGHAKSMMLSGLVRTFDDRTSLSRIKGYFPANEAEQAPQLKAGEWINSKPLSLKDLRGRVVVVDFWTFGCPNCRSTFPALKQFDERYREQGLTLIGVHTPEFDHEKDLKSVKSSVNKLGIKYPVVTDNHFETWKAYGAKAWPSMLIIDKQGRIRYVHVGQGAHDEQERVIKALLAESV